MQDTDAGIRFAYIRKVFLAYTTLGSWPVSKDWSYQTCSVSNSPRKIAICDHEDGAHVALALPHGGQQRELAPGAAQHAAQRLVAVHAGIAAAIEAAIEAEEDRRGGRVGAGAVRGVAACDVKSK